MVETGHKTAEDRETEMAHVVVLSIASRTRDEPNRSLAPTVRSCDFLTDLKHCNCSTEANSNSDVFGGALCACKENVILRSDEC